MSYTTLEKQIRLLPEECLEEVSDYIEFVIFKYQSKKRKERAVDTNSFFGLLKQLPDGLELRRSLRDEWE